LVSFSFLPSDGGMGSIAGRNLAITDAIDVTYESNLLYFSKKGYRP
jgi:hypothetical protein